MRIALLIVLVTLAGQSAPAPRTPVLVELFTSEGCSSCPPADTLLAKLAKEQPVAGAEIVPLELHVTYWDDLGWKDPMSLGAATTRQQTYADRVFGSDRVYTPQAVVDGRTEAIGSDEAALRKAVARAAAQPHVPVTVAASADGHTANATVTAGANPAGRGPFDLLVAVVEDDVTSAVSRGENGGRTLHHDAVVRAVTVGPLDPAASPAHVSLPLDPAWQRSHLRVAAAILVRKTGQIIGSGITPLQLPAP